jgi:hypothetical protein
MNSTFSIFFEISLSATWTSTLLRTYVLRTADEGVHPKSHLPHFERSHPPSHLNEMSTNNLYHYFYIFLVSNAFIYQVNTF